MVEGYPTPSDVESVSSSSDPDYDALTTSNTANNSKQPVNRAAADESGGDDDDDDDDEPEQVSVVSLLDDRVFPDAPSMLAYCRDRFGFDFVAVRDRLGLDFHGCVRLINLVRRSVKEGVALPEEITADHLADDRLLIPVLEDDAMIFCLDELPERAGQAQGAGAAATGKEPLVEELLQKNTQLQAELEQFGKQFSNYRLAVEQTLDQRWGVEVEGESDMAESSKTAAAAEGGKKKDEKEDDDSAYYESYAHNGIHETMLKDAVRTDAYRDFIYTNKHLFAGKVVLDIGCGTGILSMFCARAGAAKVLAVDNSAILDRAREIIFDNGLDHVITCLRGRIEEVTLPVAKVDVIVSEWMGYCLLFEAMLPSVLFARDRYLKPDGLLVPSHASMWIAPVSDPGYVSDQVGFWRDVYGFDMRAMQRDIYKDVRVAALTPDAVRGSPSAFRTLDLHTATVEDLAFEDKWQTTVLLEAAEGLDGFLVWFDIFFGESRQEVVEAGATAKEWVAAGRGRVAFTTGPYDAETHWKQGLFLLDEKRAKKLRVVAGNKLAGEISYAVPEGRGQSRHLTIKITWAVEGGGDKSSQTWLLQ